MFAPQRVARTVSGVLGTWENKGLRTGGLRSLWMLVNFCVEGRVRSKLSTFNFQLSILMSH